MDLRKKIIKELETFYIDNNIKSRQILDAFTLSIYLSKLLTIKLKVSENVFYYRFSLDNGYTYNTVTYSYDKNNCSFLTTKKKVFFKLQDD